MFYCDVLGISQTCFLSRTYTHTQSHAPFVSPQVGKKKPNCRRKGKNYKGEKRKGKKGGDKRRGGKHNSSPMTF